MLNLLENPNQALLRQNTALKTYACKWYRRERLQIIKSGLHLLSIYTIQFLFLELNSGSGIFPAHVVHEGKIFRILSEQYWNRRKRFELRFNLIASLATTWNPSEK